MRTILFGFCLLLVSVMTVQAEFLEMFVKPLEECAKEMPGVDPTIFISRAGDQDDQVNAKDLADLKAVLSQDVYKCLPQCMMKKFGVVDNSGKWLADKSKEFHEDKPEAAAVVDKCVAAHTESNSCERNGHILMCVLEKFMKAN